MKFKAASVLSLSPNLLDTHPTHTLSSTVALLPLLLPTTNRRKPFLGVCTPSHGV